MYILTLHFEVVESQLSPSIEVLQYFSHFNFDFDFVSWAVLACVGISHDSLQNSKHF